MIKIKRVYDEPLKEDGYRILVDRLWPRGLTKEHAAVDLWLKDIAPSTPLRQWYHETKKWDEFQKKYRNELIKKKALIEKLTLLEQEKKSLTLVYAAKDQEQNNAVILKKVLQND